MYNFDNLLKGTIKSDIASTENVEILFINIQNKGDYNSYAIFDIPLHGRHISKTGYIESIYELQILIKYDDLDKFNAICRNDNIYCTFPTTRNNGLNGIINKSLKLTNKSFEEYNKSSIGYATYTLTLQENSLSTKTISDNLININNIRNLSSSLNDSILSDLVNFYEVSIDTIDQTKSIISSMTSSIRGVIGIYNTIITTTAELQNTLFTLSSAIDTLLTIPTQFANQLDIIINNFSKLSDNTVGQFNIIKSFLTTFSFNTYDKDISNYSENNYKATNTVNQYICCQMFSNACEILSNVDFEVKEEIDLKLTELNEMYNKLDFIENVDIILIIEKQKNICETILLQKKTLLVGFTTFNVNYINAFDFCYLIYNDIEKLTDIYKWNNDIDDIRLLNGNIKAIV